MKRLLVIMFEFNVNESGDVSDRVVVYRVIIVFYLAITASQSEH